MTRCCLKKVSRRIGTARNKHTSHKKESKITRSPENLEREN